MATLTMMPAQPAPCQLKWSSCEQQQLYSGADKCDTFMLHSYACWGGLDSEANQGSTAVTDQYGYELSTDSGLSEDACLACNELLVEPSPQLPGLPLDQQPCSTKQPSSCEASASVCGLKALGSSSLAQDVRETIRNEMRREAETRPCQYWNKHAGCWVTHSMRQHACLWAIQIVDSFSQQQETLFLAISYLDRFLSVTQDAVHMDGLQLATLACLSLASKQTEVTQPTAAEWTWLLQGNSWGTKEQLARMEWVVMDNLDWRGVTPTAWWFLHLFCYGLGTCPAQSICMAAYLLELGMLEGGCLAFSYSSLAAAALLLGHSCVEQQLRLSDAAIQPLTIQMLMTLAPELNLHQVYDACKVLAALHHAACSQPAPAPDQPLQGVQLARAKYCTDVWHNVGAWAVPVDCTAVLERL